MLISTTLGNFDTRSEDLRGLVLAAERHEDATRLQVRRDVVREARDELLERGPSFGQLAPTFELHRKAIPRERIRRRLRDEATKRGNPIHKRGGRPLTTEAMRPYRGADDIS